MRNTTSALTKATLPEAQKVVSPGLSSTRLDLPSSKNIYEDFDVWIGIRNCSLWAPTCAISLDQ